MENLRSFVTEQCRVIIDGVQEEADHWKEIHAMLQQFVLFNQHRIFRFI